VEDLRMKPIIVEAEPFPLSFDDEGFPHRHDLIVLLFSVHYPPE
jgi:hypothetical protein